MDVDDTRNVLTQQLPLPKENLAFPFIFQFCFPENQMKVKYKLGLIGKVCLDWEDYQ